MLTRSGLGRGSKGRDIESAHGIPSNKTST
jgi:hypothetical protein